jgi:hypothetical protein
MRKNISPASVPLSAALENQVSLWQSELAECQAELSRIGPMRPGSLTQQFRRGANGKRDYWMLGFSFRRRQRQKYVRAEDVPQVKTLLANFKRWRELIDRCEDLSIKIADPVLGSQPDVPPVTTEAIWENMFAQLVAFKAKHAHCNVPFHCEENPRLGLWVYGQRQNYRRKRTNRLTPERQKRLEDLGILWRPVEARWERRFAQLVVFHKKHGHCDVPPRAKKYVLLRRWLVTQRNAYRSKNLTPERQRRLLSLGLKLP